MLLRICERNKVGISVLPFSTNAREIHYLWKTSDSWLFGWTKYKRHKLLFQPKQITWTAAKSFIVISHYQLALDIGFPSQGLMNPYFSKWAGWPAIISIIVTQKMASEQGKDSLFHVCYAFVKDKSSPKLPHTKTNKRFLVYLPASQDNYIRLTKYHTWPKSSKSSKYLGVFGGNFKKATLEYLLKVFWNLTP